MVSRYSKPKNAVAKPENVLYDRKTLEIRESRPKRMKPFLTLVVLLGMLSFGQASTKKYSSQYIQSHSPVTGRDFFDYLRRLGISEQEVLNSKGKLWLSVGEGLSNFTAEAAKRGVETTALDALVINPHAPQRSKIGLAQSLPFTDQKFDRVISVWLMDLFFNPKHFSDPETGKLSLLEMIRVTKIGGDIRISPVKEPALTAAVDELKKSGIIRYEILPYYQGGFRNEGKQRLFHIDPVTGKEPGSFRITRLK
jgi:hypothetical protein